MKLSDLFTTPAMNEESESAREMRTSYSSYDLWHRAALNAKFEIKSDPETKGNVIALDEKNRKRGFFNTYKSFGYLNRDQKD